jgi:HNH endonuclease
MKLIKNACEICGFSDASALHLHHIIERTDVNTSNHHRNLAIICSNCHHKVHANEIKIIGVFPSTKPPNGRTLVFEIDGCKNLDIENNRVQTTKSWKLNAHKPG